MLFSSLTFLFIFLPIILILYFSIKNIKFKNIILLIFSLLFYAWGEPIYSLLMIFTITITYFFGRIIDKFDFQKQRNKKKVSFIISILFILMILGFFKYSNFLISSINSISGLSLGFLDLSLPIGISFYSFQAISYLADVYNKKTKVQKSLLDLGLYISLFPQLIAGPIVRYETVENEIKNRTHSISNIEMGIKRFIIGLSKKVIIANNMAYIADAIFDSVNPGMLGTNVLWLGALAYTLQIYFDFSGYSDMAIGLGKIFGFNFLENFNYPYVATSITDFWHRWHISLSSWFRDYVYIPLGGSRVSKIRNVRNILIVWMLTGLWHGANWNFVIWGLYYGFLLILEKYVLKNIIKSLPKFINWIITIVVIIVGWVIFRNTDVNVMLDVLKNMFVFKKSDFSDFIFNNVDILYNLYYLLPAIILCFPWKKIFKINNINNFFIQFFVNVCYLILFAMNIGLLVSNTYNPFIYFRF